MALTSVRYLDEAAVVGECATALFQQEWLTYRKMVDNNYLFHQEAYARLRDVLLNEFHKPFRFLDVACGDASATVGALKGTCVAHYHGIDASDSPLRLAVKNVSQLACPVSFSEGDFVETLKAWREPVDVVWIGLSLHHLLAPAKLEVMREIHRIVGDAGLLLIYENATLEGESRRGWLDRWDLQRPEWTAYTPREWDRVAAHVHAADYPEAPSQWRRLGRDAGFHTGRELFVTPTKLFRMYLFQP